MAASHMTSTREDSMTSLLEAAPKPLKQAGRRVYMRMGVVTAPLRLRPMFLMIGAQRCGTTSLFRAIMRKDRKSTRLNSSHTVISYAVFCLKKKGTGGSGYCFHNEPVT